MTTEEARKIILGTGNYANVKSGNTVSITGDGGNAWDYYGPAYKKLAPKWVTYDEYAKAIEAAKYSYKYGCISVYEYRVYVAKAIDNYIESFYETRLKALNVFELLAHLRERFGEEIIFLCHEEIDEFCHRRLLADFIQLSTGIYIPEIIVDEYGSVEEAIIKNRYTEKLKTLMKK